MKRLLGLLAALTAAGAIGWFSYALRARQAQAPSPPPALEPRENVPAELSFVGSQSCKPCHASEWSRWSASHHAQAMKDASREHVLAPLGERRESALTSLEKTPGVRARFFRDDAGVQVEAEGPDGGMASYEVPYTFGLWPLQQYLARFPNGRLQALPVAWDAREKTEGGQRWFQLYPDVRDHHDQLHWTGPYQTWNLMCAECHVTGYVKAYDAQADAYASKWSELGVGCEACHGPASAHVSWARTGGAYRGVAHGFAHDLRARGTFGFATPDARIATRLDAPSAHANGECAACHARAGSVDDRARPDPRTALSEHHRPALLVAPEYWPSGEQHEEVFVWGSFAASKMAARGVTCGDCHEPHTSDTLASDNTLCTRCHQAAAFDTPAHHHHRTASAGALCVSCHMASERYMGVDDRRDHSFQLPRPDLTLETGSPNACNRCHTDQTPAWAAQALDRWFEKPWRARAHWASTFASAERHSSAAQKPLAELALDRSKPAIVRASALRLWAGVPRARPVPMLLSLVDDAEALVRAEALPLLAQLPPAERWRRARAHLEDSDRLVRLEAAELLVGLPQEVVGSEGAPRLQRALAALVLSLEQQADFPANATQLAQVLLRAGELAEARRWLARARARDAQFLGAYLASSELERLAGDNAASARVLEQGLLRLPKAAGLYYASGLALVRLGQKREALARLARASELAPDDANIAYTHGVALQDQGEHGRAVELLERCLRSQPENGELLEELLRIGLSRHDFALMRRHLPAFERLFPDDPALAVLRAAMQQEGREAREP